MEKWNFKSLVRTLVDRATNAREDKTYGDKHPHLLRISSTAANLDGVRKYDKVLAEKLEKVEVANQELDDYILTKKELVEG